MAEPAATRAAQLAARAHQLVRGDHVWKGSPLTEDDLEQVAMAAAAQFDETTLLKGLREAGDPAAMLRGFMAIAWAAGFKTGSMLAEEQHT